MHDDAGHLAAAHRHCHGQRAVGQRRVVVLAERMPEHSARGHVHHRGQVELALTSRNLGTVAVPLAVNLLCGEVPPDQVRCPPAPPPGPGEDPTPRLVVKKLAEVLHVPESEAMAVAKNTALDLAAAAQAELDQRRADKAVAYWALATALGLLASATLGLYLLHVVGLQATS